MVSTGKDTKVIESESENSEIGMKQRRLTWAASCLKTMCTDITPEHFCLILFV